MNLGEGEHEQVVVVATLIEGRHVASLGVENPLHSLAGRTQTYDVVLRVVHIGTLLDSIAELLGVLLQTLQRLVLADVLAEVVVCFRIGVLREVDRVLHNSYVVLVDEVLAVSHLQHNVGCGELEVLDLTSRQRNNVINILLGVGVDAL